MTSKERDRLAGNKSGLKHDGEVDTASVTARPIAITDSAGGVSSQAVSWFSVHEYIQPWLKAVDTWPMVGTPEWVALDDGDPRKWCALLDAAQHWALRLETSQEALAEASKAVAGAAKWGAVGTAIQRRRASCYIPRQVAS